MLSCILLVGLVAILEYKLDIAIFVFTQKTKLKLNYFLGALLPVRHFALVWQVCNSPASLAGSGGAVARRSAELCVCCQIEKQNKRSLFVFDFRKRRAEKRKQ